MTRAERATRGARACTKTIDLALAETKRLAEKLTASDRQILRGARSYPIDVETLESASPYQLLWLEYHKLVKTWMDPAERLFIRTTQLGTSLERAARGEDPKSPEKPQRKAKGQKPQTLSPEVHVPADAQPAGS